MAGSIDAARIFCVNQRGREDLQDKEGHTLWKLAFPANNQVVQRRKSSVLGGVKQHWQ
jgi:hypothetical protein